MNNANNYLKHMPYFKMRLWALNFRQASHDENSACFPQPRGVDNTRAIYILLKKKRFKKKKRFSHKKKKINTGEVEFFS